MDHQIYFLSRGLLNASLEASEIFPHLNQFGWATIIRHVYSHEIENLQPRGVLKKCLEENDLTFFCLDTIKMYLWQNSLTDDLGNGLPPNIPSSEENIFQHASDLYQEIIHNYSCVNFGKERNRWKLVKKVKFHTQKLYNL